MCHELQRKGSILPRFHAAGTHSEHFCMHTHTPPSVPASAPLYSASLPAAAASWPTFPRLSRVSTTSRVYVYIHLRRGSPPPPPRLRASSLPSLCSAGLSFHLAHSDGVSPKGLLLTIGNTPDKQLLFLKQRWNDSNDNVVHRYTITGDHS